MSIRHWLNQSGASQLAEELEQALHNKLEGSIQDSPGHSRPREHASTALRDNAVLIEIGAIRTPWTKPCAPQILADGIIAVL